MVKRKSAVLKEEEVRVVFQFGAKAHHHHGHRQQSESKTSLLVSLLICEPGGISHISSRVFVIGPKCDLFHIL